MYDAGKTQEFYDAYAGFEWARLGETAYGRLQAIIHADVLERHVQSGDRVLDVGCGPGRFSMTMARQGATPTLLDISRGQLQIAGEKLAEADLTRQTDGLVQADVSKLPVGPDQQFDVVVAFGGALSYVCEQRRAAALELMRVTRPGGILLVSVMSRLGTVQNIVRRPALPVLKDPDAWHLWSVLRDGALPPFPSRIEGMQHPAMHLFTAAELQETFAGCDILEMAGSNVSTYEGSTTFEELAEDEAVWNTAVELERELCRESGLVDTGSHIIMAARKR